MRVSLARAFSTVKFQQKKSISKVFYITIPQQKLITFSQKSEVKGQVTSNTRLVNYSKWSFYFHDIWTIKYNKVPGYLFVQLFGISPSQWPQKQINSKATFQFFSCSLKIEKTPKIQHKSGTFGQPVSPTKILDAASDRLHHSNA